VSASLVWAILVGLILFAAYYIARVAKQNDDGDGSFDTGLAILEFGRAFPDEAIRSLHGTADGSAFFVRLHDNKAGLMRNRRNHYACHVIQPGRVRIVPIANSKGFTAEFLDSPTQNGTFVFKTEKVAAEVSLWLLNNYVSIAEQEHTEMDGAGKSAHRGDETDPV
jgi:hypothetical protein